MPALLAAGRAGLLLAGLATAAHAQAPASAPGDAPQPIDTVRLTLPEAEQRLVQNNLQLLA